MLGDCQARGRIKKIQTGRHRESSAGRCKMRINFPGFSIVDSLGEEVDNTPKGGDSLGEGKYPDGDPRILTPEKDSGEGLD